MRADIDYGFYEARTTFGRIGVKCWINKGEIMPEGFSGMDLTDMDSPRPSATIAATAAVAAGAAVPAARVAAAAEAVAAVAAAASAAAAAVAVAAAAVAVAAAASAAAAAAAVAVGGGRGGWRLRRWRRWWPAAAVVQEAGASHAVPKRVKHRKQHRGPGRAVARPDDVQFGEYGIKSLAPAG